MKPAEVAHRLRSRLQGRPAGGVGRASPATPARPTSTSTPGSRVVTEGFFDRVPGFFETSETSSFRWRLNLRHEAIFTENADLLSGARVLDIASHDGRWSMAALQAGAAHVTGVEARPDLVAHATTTLRDNPGADQVRDYRIGRRVTCRLTRG